MPAQPDSAPHADSVPETFDEAVARHIALLRPRPESWSTTVPSPTVDQRGLDARQRTEAVMKVGFLCSAFTPAFVLVPYSGVPVVAARVLAGLWFFVCFVVFVVPAFTVTSADAEPSWVDVPDDAARAHEAFPGALARLRAGDAAPDVIAAVEAQRPVLDASLVHLGRLRADNDPGSRLSVALRDRIVTIVAQVQALVDLEARRQELAYAALLADGLQDPSTARLAEAAQSIVDETRIIESTLAGRAGDSRERS